MYLYQFPYKSIKFFTLFPMLNLNTVSMHPSPNYCHIFCLQYKYYYILS